MTLYLSASDVKTTHTITSSFSDDAIDRALAAACEGVDRACGRPHGFGRDDPDADPVERFYRPVDGYKVMIDDLVTLSAFSTSPLGNNTFDHNWTENKDFVLTPENSPLEGKPFTRIEINPWGATQAFPYWAPRSAKVVGWWGWPVTPAGVVEAASLLTNRLLQRDKSAPLGIQFNADMAARIVYSDPDIKNLLTPFMREEI